MVYLHIKLRHTSEASDPSLCGPDHGTKYFTVVDGPENLSQLTDELIAEQNPYPLCPTCKDVLSTLPTPNKIELESQTVHIKLRTKDPDDLITADPACKRHIGSWCIFAAINHQRELSALQERMRPPQYNGERSLCINCIAAIQRS